MRSWVKKQGLRFQVVFWVTLISIVAFTGLFSLNYTFFKSRLIKLQDDQLRSVTELVIMSPFMTDLDKSLAHGVSDAGVNVFFRFIDDLVDKIPIDGILVFYRDSGNLNLVSKENPHDRRINSDLDVPVEVLDTCELALNTGVAQECTVLFNGNHWHYFIYPVNAGYTFKYAICSYVSSTGLELDLMRYMGVNILSFIIILLIFDLLLFFAINGTLIKPIIEIEQMVDYFIYQASGKFTGYGYLFHGGSNGNEIVLLRKSVGRLEGLIKFHEKDKEAADRYKKWLEENIDRLDAKNSSLNFEIKAAQFEALCDHDTLCGNQKAWEKKCQEVDHLIANGSLQFLQMFYFKFLEGFAIVPFVKEAMQAAGIFNDIPMEMAFRISDYEFVFVFLEDGHLPVLLGYVTGTGISFGHAWYLEGEHHSMQDILDACKKNLN